MSPWFDCAFVMTVAAILSRIICHDIVDKPDRADSTEAKTGKLWRMSSKPRTLSQKTGSTRKDASEHKSFSGGVDGQGQKGQFSK